LKSVFYTGDVLFGKLRSYLRKYWLADRSGVCSTEIWVLSPVKAIATSEFLFQVVQSESFITASGTSYGTHMPRSDWSAVKSYELSVPPCAEQRAIAEALGDMDDLISTLEKLIAKKRNIKQAVMQQLLTGKTRLHGFSGEWEVKSLGEVSVISMGQSPRSASYNRAGIGIPLVQGNADIENRRSIARVWTTQITKEGAKGDLLLTVRAPVGSVGRVSERCCLGRGVCSLSPRIDGDFLFHALAYAEPNWKRLEQGSTFTSANSTQVSAFSMLIPARLDEQAAIAEVLTDMDEELSLLGKRLKKTRNIKQAMMQELLTGKTRLV
jgi:type I restriction enzyme S subunit